MNSTLVLIDGQRTANYPLADDGQRAFVDLNTIPFNAVDRVETLKDGASSTYGADAIAGVVNIITKQNFQGADVDGSFGGSEHGGGAQYRFNGEVGVGDLSRDKYNAYFDFEYQRDEAIHADQRGFPFNTNDLSSIGGQNNNTQPGGNGDIYGTVQPGTLSSPGGVAVLANGQTVVIPPDISTGVPAAGSVVQPLRACGSFAVQVSDAGGTYCQQNLAKYGDVQPFQERVGGLARFAIKPTDNFQAYVSASYFQNHVYADGAPAQIQSTSPNNLLNVALPATLPNGALNPNNPFAASGQAALINYAFGDIPTYTDYLNHVARLETGVKGSAYGWDYTSNLVIAHSWLDTKAHAYLNYDVLTSDIINGAYNFINPDANTQATRDALISTQRVTSTSDLDSLDVNASREIFNLPAGPVGVALGGSFRYEAVDNPALNPTNNLQGLGNARTEGNRTVGSIYGEVNVPVVTGLEVNVSGRYDHYSDFGDNFSPKFGIKYKPFRTLALRATYSQGFRAPSFAESGNSASQGFVTFNFDPTVPEQAAFIAAHNGDQYASSYQLSSITTANPDLKPETSESFTAGFVWQPVRALSVSLDYYHIRKTNVIAQADPSVAIAAYYSGQAIPAGYTVVSDAPDSQAPNAQTRILSIGSPYINADSLETSGADLNVQVNHRLPFDVLWTSTVDVTDIFDYDFTIGGDTFNYVGKQAPYVTSSGAGTPKFRATWENSFRYGPLKLTGTLFWVSGMRQTDPSFSSGCLYSFSDGSCPNVHEFYDYDLNASYDLTPKVTATLDVLNLFDSGPQFDPANYAAVNYNPTYSQAGAIGRFFRIGLRAKF